MSDCLRPNQRRNVPFSGGMNQILTKHTAGNKSGALLLTIFALTTGAATNRLP